jgi:hypothetical protein
MVLIIQAYFYNILSFVATEAKRIYIRIYY